MFPTAAAIAHDVAARRRRAVDVIQEALAAVETRNPALNAIVTVNPRALDDARALDARLAAGIPPGPLAVVPVAIKDVTPVAGLRTTFGSPIYADHVPDADAEIVRRLRAAGAIVIGKSNVPEFAAGANTWNAVFGRTRNPHDARLT